MKCNPLYIVTTSFHSSTSVGGRDNSFSNFGYASERKAWEAAHDMATQLAEQFVYNMMHDRHAPLTESEARARVRVEQSPRSGVWMLYSFDDAEQKSVNATCFYNVAKITPV